MLVNAYYLDVREPRGEPVLVLRTLYRDAELVLLEAGGYVRVRTRVHVRVDANGYPSFRAQPPGRLVYVYQLLPGLYVEHQYPGGKRVVYLALRLPYARIDDFLRQHSRRYRTVKLPARNDVRASAHARERPDDGRVGVRLHSVADDMRYTRERLVVYPEMPGKRFMAVNVKGGADFSRYVLKRDVLAEEPALHIPEIVHKSPVSQEIPVVFF